MCSTKQHVVKQKHETCKYPLARPPLPDPTERTDDDRNGSGARPIWYGLSRWVRVRCSRSNVCRASRDGDSESESMPESGPHCRRTQKKYNTYGTSARGQ